MKQVREAALWMAVLWGGALPRREAKDIVRHWLETGHQRLSELFGDLDAACAELGLDARQRAALVACVDGAASAGQRLATLADHNIELVTRPDIAYPAAFAENLGEAGAPYALFVAGDLGILSESFVAIVGAAKPEPDARNLAPDLVLPISGAGYHLLGGYAQGVDRLVLEASEEQGQGHAMILPCGIEPMLATLERWQLPAEGGTRLVVSPFVPDAKPSSALADARLALIAALADAIVFVAPDQGPAEASWWRAAKAWAPRLLIWSGSDAEIARAWLEQGAQAFDGAADLTRLLAGDQGPGSRWPTDADLAIEPLEPFENADQAIEALGSMGRVPGVLAERLRESEFYQHDPDPYLDESDESEGEKAAGQSG